VTLRAAEKPSAGKIMRRILRRIAEGHTGDLGDVTTLADPAVVQDLLRERRHEARA
jgi:acetyl-CoA synthetase